MGEQEFFNKPRVKDAFASVHRYHESITSQTGKPVRFAKWIRNASRATSAKLETAATAERDATARNSDIHDELLEVRKACWLTNRDDDPNKEIVRVGVWGQIWALAVLYSLVATQPNQRLRSRRELVKEVAAFAYEKNLPCDEPDFKEIHTYSDAELKIARLTGGAFRHLKSPEEVLDLYLSTGDRGASFIPARQASLAAYVWFVHFVFHHLDKSENFRPKQGLTAQTILDHLSKESYVTPEECFWALCELLEISQTVIFRETDEDRIPAQDGLNWIEQDIWRYLHTDDHKRTQEGIVDIDTIVRQVRNTISYQGRATPDQARLLVLDGAPNTGKKAVIGDFLKLIATEDKRTFKLFIPEATDYEEDLPVLCLQTRDREYHALCVEVLVFLERIQPENKKPTPQEESVRQRWAVLEQSGGTPSLQPLLERIELLHKKAPALFIFLDVRHTSNSDIGGLIRGNGIKRLLETLLDGNKRSRFVLTTNATEGYLDAHSPKKVSTKLPTCERIFWYLSEDQHDRFVELAEVHDFTSFRSAEIDGHILMSLSLLFSQTDVEPHEFFQIFKECSAATRKPKSADHILERLIASWQKSRLLPYLALICGSDDGMTSATIQSCIKEWRKANTGVLPTNTADAEEMLFFLSRLGRGLVLRRLPLLHTSLEELRFDEPSLEEDTLYSKRWEFDQNFSKRLRSILAESPIYSQLMRNAYRLIASRARSRARVRMIKGKSIRRAHVPRVPERGIQALVTLLLSLEANESVQTYQNGPHVRPLSHDTPSVFSIGPKFDQPKAIAYIFEALMKSEIDLDFRLSMNLDADALRFQLYVLICARPGTAKTWFLDRQDARIFDRSLLPNELGSTDLKHLDVFDAKTKADLLTRLALSAAYVGNTPTLRWAEKKIFELFQQDKSGEIAELLSRVISAKVDLEILIGKPLSPIHKKNVAGLPDMRKNLVDVQHKLQNSIRKICPNVPSKIDQPRPKATLSEGEISAWFRLRSREIYLRALCEGYEFADPGLSEMIDLDQFVQSVLKRSTSFSQHGRTGRVNMRTALGHFPVLGRSGATQTSHASTALSLMIHANVSRLIKYDGSERALTLLDHANQLLLTGKHIAALHAAREARRITFRGSSSDQIRLSALFSESLMIIVNSEVIITDKTPESSAIVESDIEAVEHNLEYISEIIDRHEWNLSNCFKAALEIRLECLRLSAGNPSSVDKKALFDFAAETALAHGALGIMQELSECLGDQL